MATGPVEVPDDIRDMTISRISDNATVSAATTPTERRRAIHAGPAGCHLEDRVSRKRRGHLDGKELVPTDVMVRRLGAAVSARCDDSFVICARTGAAGTGGSTPPSNG